MVSLGRCYRRFLFPWPRISRSESAKTFGPFIFRTSASFHYLYTKTPAQQALEEISDTKVYVPGCEGYKELCRKPRSKFHVRLVESSL